MIAFIFSVTVVVVCLIIELIFSSFGLLLPLSLIALHYLAFSRHFPLAYPLALLFAGGADVLYGREFPLTLLTVGLFVLLIRYNRHFGSLSTFQQSLFGGFLAGITVALNLLPGFAGVPFNGETVWAAVSLILFAAAVNLLLTPILFSLMDFLAVRVGISSAFDLETRMEA